MPSGSHGGSHGGGGSHFGGGSSSHSSGGSSGRPMRPMRPMRFHIGPHFFFVSGERVSSIVGRFMVMIFLGLFIGLFAGLALPSTNRELEQIRFDYERYQTMIDYAEEHTDHIVEGRITGTYYNEDADAYYFTYELTTEQGRPLEGYTYSVYTRSEIMRFNVGDTIQLAVDVVPITNLTDSIPLDYKDMPIEKDGEYRSSQSSKTILTVLLVVFSAIEGIMLISIFVSFGKSKTQRESTATQSNSSQGTSLPQNADTNSTQQSTSTYESHSYCDYCGAKLKGTESKCPNCGARLK